MTNGPAIWIDLDNAPHAHFFAPLIRDLNDQGYSPLITVRSFGQTEGLADAYGMRFTTIGAHTAMHSKFARVRATLRRAAQLIEFGLARRPVAAVSHGSRALAIASAFLGIPSMALYDYEHVSTDVFLHLCDRVLVPEIVRASAVTDHRIGYPGFKEDVYIHDFAPNDQILRQLALDPEKLIVTVRPPATWAHYQSDHSTTLFRALVDRLRAATDTQVVVLARTSQQAEELARDFDLNPPPFHLTSKAVDGLSLLYYSDAVFSGGGTMVREAALLGVAAYSTFAGTPGAVDLELERRALLTLLRSTDDIANLCLHKRVRPERPKQASPTREFILKQIIQLASKDRPS